MNNDDVFGYYITGLTDGEGSFTIKQGNDRETVMYGSFKIELRDDDWEIIHRIQKYFNCGYINNNNRNNSCSEPTIIYTIRKTKDLIKIIIPHFVKYPLQAKKKNDFSIWKEAIELIWKVEQRPTIWNGRCVESKWEYEEWLHINFLKRCLKEERKYQKP